MHRNVSQTVSLTDFDRKAYERTLETIRSRNLCTVCIEADCPNRYECFSNGTATFMILGNVCTRRCMYCGVKHGRPEDVDADEPKKIADAVKAMRIKHAVITCVTRDDLTDGGASHFADVVSALKRTGCSVEVLISDLKGNEDALKTIVASHPDVLGHNIETVRRLFPAMRPGGTYERSLAILKKAKRMRARTKSGLMVGLGETMDEVFATLADLRDAGCDYVTIGQYLKPSGAKHATVKKHYSGDEFRKIRDEAVRLGFIRAEAGTLVRSSYHARA